MEVITYPYPNFIFNLWGWYSVVCDRIMQRYTSQTICKCCNTLVTEGPCVSSQDWEAWIFYLFCTYQMFMIESGSYSLYFATFKTHKLQHKMDVDPVVYIWVWSDIYIYNIRIYIRCVTQWFCFISLTGKFYRPIKWNRRDLYPSFFCLIGKTNGTNGETTDYIYMYIYLTTMYHMQYNFKFWLIVWTRILGIKKIGVNNMKWLRSVVCLFTFNCPCHSLTL